MKKNKNAYIYIMYIMLSVFLLPGKAWGQNITYNKERNSWKITHKAPGWELPDGEVGLVDANGWNGFQSTYSEKIQNAHAFVDTIYMHKGQTIELAVPDILISSNYKYSIGSYQRWYNYRIGGHFYIDDQKYFVENGNTNSNDYPRDC